MDVLLSGYNGFVGQNLVKAFGTNYHIHALSRSSNSDLKCITWDELSSRSLQPIDAVIHLAGKAHDLKNTSSPEEYFDVNTGLTKKLFDVFLQSPARDFIYFSSVKAAADRVDGLLQESITPAPETPYGLSKLKAEEYLLNSKLPAGKRLFILRPCMIHGPGNKGNLNLLYRFVKRGVPYPLAAFDNRRSFLSIDNLTYVVDKILADEHIQGGVYHIADDAPLSTNEVIRIIAEASNLKPKFWTISPQVIQRIAMLGDKVRLPLNSERLKKLTESYIVDNTKIKNALKIESFPVSSRDGLYSTIRSF
jgi:nucleoside-diphosphate-sugar epimerase